MFFRVLPWLLLLAACSPDDESLGVLEFPNRTFTAAFALTVDENGRPVAVSDVVGLEDGAVVRGPERLDVAVQPGQSLYFVGVERASIEPLNPTIAWEEDWSEDSILAPTAELVNESCESGRTLAETHRLRVPVASHATVYSYDAESGFELTPTEQRPEGLDMTSLQLPLRPFGCDPGYPTELQPFVDGTLRRTPIPFIGKRIGRDRLLVGNRSTIAVYDRTSQDPLTPVSFVRQPAGAAPFDRAAYRENRDGTWDVVVSTRDIPMEEETRDPLPSAIYALRVEGSTITFVGTSTVVPYRLRDLEFVPGGVLAVAKTGAVLHADQLLGPWTEERELVGRALTRVLSTGLSTRPHLVASEDGPIYLGDFRAGVIDEPTTPSMSVRDVDTLDSADGLHIWTSSKDVSLQPSRIYHLPPRGSWVERVIRTPTGGFSCSEEDECGQRRQIKILFDLALRAHANGTTHRVFGMPEKCTALLSYRSEDYCPTLFTLAGVDVAGRDFANNFFALLDLEGDTLTAVTAGSQVFEIELPPL